MVIPEQFVGGAMVKLGLESFVVPLHLVPPERPQPGDLVIKLNSEFMLEALVNGEKWTEVRSRSVDQTERGILVRWTWVWFARTKNFKEGGKAAPFCEVWGGAWFLGETGPANPQDSGVVATLLSWHACWPTTHTAVLHVIDSMGIQCKGYGRHLFGWHFGGAIALSTYFPMAKSEKQTGFFRFKAAAKEGGMTSNVRYHSCPTFHLTSSRITFVYPANLSH